MIKELSLKAIHPVNKLGLIANISKLNGIKSSKQDFFDFSVFYILLENKLIS